MHFSPDQLNQVLTLIPYPVGKAQVIQLAQQFNANEQILGLLQLLPDKTYNSAQDIQNDLSSLGNLGDLGGFKL